MTRRLGPSDYFVAISRVWKIVLKVLNPYEEVEGKVRLTRFSKIVLMEHLTLLAFISLYTVNLSFGPDFIELAGWFLMCARNLVYQVFLMLYHSKLNKLVDRILADRQSTRKFPDQWALSLRYCRTEFWAPVVFLVSFAVALILASLSVFFFQVNQNRLTLNFQIVFLPFDGVSFNWLLNYLYQLSFYVFVGIFSLAYIPSLFLLMNHTCWGYDNLILLLEKMQTITDDHKHNHPLHINSVNFQVKKIVQQSLHFMEWQEKVQDYLELIFMLEFSSLSFILCMFLFALFSNPFGSVSIYVALAVALVQLFFYCWMGTRVNNRIERLTTVIYEVKWYMMKPSLRKDIQLILVMTQNMKGFNGIFNEVNMETFKKVLQFTYTLLTFLKSTT